MTSLLSTPRSPLLSAHPKPCVPMALPSLCNSLLLSVVVSNQHVYTLSWVDRVYSSSCSYNSSFASSSSATSAGIYHVIVVKFVSVELSLTFSYDCHAIFM